MVNKSRYAFLILFLFISFNALDAHFPKKGIDEIPYLVRQNSDEALSVVPPE